MRSQQILEKLRRADVGTPLTKFFPQSGALRELDTFRAKARTLAGIPGFEAFQEFLEGSVIFGTTAASRDIDPSDWRPLTGEISANFQMLAGLRWYLEALAAERTDHEVFVKLPDTSSFRESVELQDTLERALSQLVLLPSVSGKMVVHQWETGSQWITLGVGSLLATVVIGTAAWSAAVVYKKIQEGRLHAQHVRSLQLKNETLEEILQAQSKMLGMLVDTEARTLAAEHLGEAASPEDIERVKHTIKELAALMEKGAEIHPALQAPESVRNLFPDFKNVMQIESRTKLLTAGNLVDAPAIP